jgi:hypothetical protein
MIQLLPSESIGYERYVDGLRARNAELSEFAEYVAKRLRVVEPSLKLDSWGLAVLKLYRALTKAVSGKNHLRPRRRRPGSGRDRHSYRIRGAGGMRRTGAL